MAAVSASNSSSNDARRIPPFDDADDGAASDDADSELLGSEAPDASAAPDAPAAPTLSPPTRESDTLPCGSMSSTRTSRSWPSSTTSSTRSTRLPCPRREMWMRPSRPGRMLTNAPNLVMLTTLPG